MAKPEPVTEPSFSDRLNENQEEETALTESLPQSESVPTAALPAPPAESEAVPTPAAAPELESEVAPVSEPDPEPAPAAEPIASALEPPAAPDPEPEVQRIPAPEAVLVAASAPAVEPEAEVIEEAAPDSVAEPEIEAIAGPEPVLAAVEAEPVAKPEIATISEAAEVAVPELMEEEEPEVEDESAIEAASVPEPVVAPETVCEPRSAPVEAVETIVERELEQEVQTVSEPDPQPASEPETVSEALTAPVEAAETVVEAELEPEAPSLPEPELSFAETPEAATEPASEPIEAAEPLVETSSAPDSFAPGDGVSAEGEAPASAADAVPPLALVPQPSAEEIAIEKANEKTAAKLAARQKKLDESSEQSPFSIFVGQVYDGPLDLLLDLIRKQDIDIYDIPIATITAQFLAYVNQLRSGDVDVAGEFIYTASLLIHIKSRMLLPRVATGAEDAAEDPRRELVERLLEHERFKNAAQMLQQKQMLEAATWTNPGAREFKDDEAAEPEIAADTVDLVRVFREILERARNRPVIDVEEDTVTVGQMIQFLARRLTMEDKPVALRRLLSHTRSERALITIFLALLEMVRLQAILLRQDRQFSEIFIKKNTSFESVMNNGMGNARDDWR
jgi:segregation and condensation protein A